MSDPSLDASLDLVAIGLGQAGGHLASEWRRRGYRALALNTAKTDLRALGGRGEGLDLPERDQLYIGLDGADGAGRDPTFGSRCLIAHKEAILDAVRSRAAGADGLIVMAGLGGGTGSAVATLTEILAVVDVPAFLVCTLPAEGESALAKVNAVRAADAVMRAPVAGRIFVDNGRLLELFPGVDVVSYFQKVNARVLQPLDELNRLNGKSDVTALRSFDGEDLRKVLLSSGTVGLHSEKLKDGVLAAADLMDVVNRAVDGGDFLARGSRLDGVAYAAVIVTGSEKALRQTPMQVFDALGSDLKKKSKGAAVFDGVYLTADDQPLRCFVLLSTLAVPQRITDLVEKAGVEGGELANKVAKDVPGLDLAAVDGLSLFRGARGAGSLPPMPASSTSLPPMPVRSAPAAQAGSGDLPVTAQRVAVKKPVAVTEVLPGSNLPQDAVLPPPTADLPELPELPDALIEEDGPDEMTMEGEPSAAGIQSLSMATGPLADMEKAVEQYRAGDKRSKERIGRKWLEDSRSPDTQLRTLAVMAMVQVGDGAFRRALTRCSNDENKEIARLAINGLEALGDVPHVE